MMFTGIVEEIGKVEKVVQTEEHALRYTIHAEKVLTDVNVGDSIAVNGVCLTVTKFDAARFAVDVMPETLRVTGFANLQTGDRLNLERAMQAQDRFGGHFVTGHIDGIGEITEKKVEANAINYEIEMEERLFVHILEKGSVAIDGVSLTVFATDREKRSCTLSLIPHTRAVTILGEKQVGDMVHIECDVLAKQMRQFVQEQMQQGRENE